MLATFGTASAVWLWALAVVLAFDPWAMLTHGFWLSFGAVASAVNITKTYGPKTLDRVLTILETPYSLVKGTRSEPELGPVGSVTRELM